MVSWAMSSGRYDAKARTKRIGSRLRLASCARSDGTGLLGEHVESDGTAV